MANLEIYSNQNRFDDYLNRLPANYQDANLVFAYYATFPTVFSPDLLFQFWFFLQDFKKNEVIEKLPMVVVSDLLQSGICHEIAYELYEFDEHIAAYIKATFAERCKAKQISLIYQLSDFASLTLEYAERYYKNSNRKNLYDMYYWKSMFIINPVEATKEIKAILGKEKAQNVINQSAGIYMQLAEYQANELNKDSQDISKLPTFSHEQDSDSIDIDDVMLRRQIADILGFNGKLPIPKFLTKFPSPSQNEIIREKEIKLIYNKFRTTFENNLRTNIKAINIIGDVGTGKTVLATQYIEHFKDNYKHIAWIGRFSHGRVAFKQIFSSLAIDSNIAKDRLFDCLIENLTKLPTPSLIVIDDVEVNDVLYQDLRYKLFNFDILTTSQSEIPFSDYTLKLNRLEIEKSLVITNSNAINFSVEKYPNVEEITINASNIQNIKISNLENLREITINQSNIKKIRISKAPKLVSLVLNESKIKILDLGNSKTLQSLTLNESVISQLSLFNGLDNLEEIVLINSNFDTTFDGSINCIKRLTINHLDNVTNVTILKTYKSIEYLNLKNNKIDTFDYSLLDELVNLKELYLQGNKLGGIFEEEANCLPALKEWIAKNESTKTQQILDLEKALNFKLKKTEDFNKIFHENLRESGFYISDIEDNVTHLNLLGFELRDLSILSSFEELVFLNLSTNRISNIESLGKLVNLESLELSNNKLDNLLPLGTLNNLSCLYLDNNEIDNTKQLPILENLIDLYIQNNKISYIDESVFDKFPRLAAIYLKGNAIENIPVEIIESGNCLENLRTFLAEQPTSELTLDEMLTLVDNEEFDKVFNILYSYNDVTSKLFINEFAIDFIGYSQLERNDFQKRLKIFLSSHVLEPKKINYTFNNGFQVKIKGIDRLFDLNIKWVNSLGRQKFREDQYIAILENEGVEIEFIEYPPNTANAVIISEAGKGLIENTEENLRHQFQDWLQLQMQKNQTEDFSTLEQALAFFIQNPNTSRKNEIINILLSSTNYWEKKMSSGLNQEVYDMFWTKNTIDYISLADITLLEVESNHILIEGIGNLDVSSDEKDSGNDRLPSLLNGFNFRIKIKPDGNSNWIIIEDEYSLDYEDYNDDPTLDESEFTIPQENDDDTQFNIEFTTPKQALDFFVENPETTRKDEIISAIENDSFFLANILEQSLHDELHNEIILGNHEINETIIDDITELNYIIAADDEIAIAGRGIVSVLIGFDDREISDIFSFSFDIRITQNAKKIWELAHNEENYIKILKKEADVEFTTTEQALDFFRVNPKTSRKDEIIDILLSDSVFVKEVMDIQLSDVISNDFAFADGHSFSIEKITTFKWFSDNNSIILAGEGITSIFLENAKNDKLEKAFDTETTFSGELYYNEEYNDWEFEGSFEFPNFGEEDAGQYNYEIVQGYKYISYSNWDWWLHIEANEENLDKIENVTYFLHNTFKEPIIIVTERSSKFKLTTSGWGVFMVKVVLRLKDNSTIELKHYLQLGLPEGEFETPEQAIGVFLTNPKAQRDEEVKELIIKEKVFLTNIINDKLIEELKFKVAFSEFDLNLVTLGLKSITFDKNLSLGYTNRDGELQIAGSGKINVLINNNEKDIKNSYLFSFDIKIIQDANYEWGLSENDLNIIDVYSDVDAEETSILEIALKDKITLDAKVVSYNNGGLILDIKGERVFLPKSLMSATPNLKDYLNTTIDVKIIEFDKNRNNYIASRKAVIEDIVKYKTDIFNTWQVGQVLEGVVKKIMDYGAFIQLDENIDGLLHRKDISWEHIIHPEKKLKLNQKISVKILKLNKEKFQVALGMKQLAVSPWESLSLKTGDVIKGNVVQINRDNVLIELTLGIIGSLASSEVIVKEKRSNLEKYFTINQEVDAKVINIDVNNQIIELSKRALTEDKWKLIDQKYSVGTILELVVYSITKNGIFLELEPYINGLLPISSFSWNMKYKNGAEFAKVGDKVKVVILSIDVPNKKITFGHKEIKENPRGDDKA